ncbi:hypothetical protein Hanom_Chr16g01436501 [Helianthus anomalus]
MSAKERRTHTTIAKVRSISRHFFLPLIIGIYRNTGSKDNATTEHNKKVLFHCVMNRSSG